MLLSSAALKPISQSTSANGLASFSLHLAILILILVFCPAAASAQTDDDEVIKVSTDLLLFPVRIRDKHGQAVAGLTEKDLSLKDADRVTTGVYFAPGADRVAMVFALDQSGSLREIITQQRDAALELFSRFSERSSVAVIRFSDVPSVVAPFNKDVAAAKSAFDFAAAPNHHTAIFDAAKKAVQTFAELPMVRSERRIVILISDGLDTASSTSPASVIAAANDKRVSFYVIHLPLFTPIDGRLSVRPPAKGFRELAEKTGGKYFLAGNAKTALLPTKIDLTPIFTAIEEDLRSQYLLGFYVAESAKDGKKHEFSVSLNPKDTEYSFGQMSYARTHKFFVNLPANSTKP